MIDLFYRGEPLYMGMLTLLLSTIMVISIIVGVSIFKSRVNQTRQYFYYLKSIGLFALVFGLFTQLLGLYGAFTAIKEWGSVSPVVLATGLRTSSIPSLYGLLIFLFSHLAQKGLIIWINRVATDS